MNKKNLKIDIIGIRHGEKVYEVLASKEEMERAKFYKNFIIINKDSRSLNYENYFDKGSKYKNSKEYNHLWYQKNKEYRKEYAREKQKIYRATNPLFKLKQNLRRRINRYIKNKSISTELILGINYEDFLIYIQSKFTEGMTLEKLGRGIHIDHIIPLSSAKTEKELLKLCHYKNLQPLWAVDNLRKSNKVDYL